MYAADTSVAIPFVRENHEFHEIAWVAVGQHKPTLPGHARFETYAQLTGDPLFRLSPRSAAAVIARNFGEPQWLTVKGTERVYALLGEGGLAGGAVYDALVAQAALDHERTLLTLDRRAERTYRAVGVRYELLS